MKRFFAIAAVLAACATDAPDTDFDDSAGTCLVVVAADGFVAIDDRRVPLEAAVLELRQRTRGMSGDQIMRFVVHLRAAPATSPVDEQRVADDMSRFLDQLQIMGVKQVTYQ